MSRSIRISDENYEKLVSISGKLRQERGRPVSIDEAIGYMWKKQDLSSLAGTWEGSDEEIERIKSTLDKGWDAWRERFA